MDATLSSTALNDPSRSGDQETGLGPVIRNAMILIRRNLLLIAAIVVAALVAAAILTMLQTPRYTATTTVEINQEAQKVLGDEIQADQESTSVADIDMFLNTQLDILRSRALAERVAQRLNLTKSERFFTAMEAPEVMERETEKARLEAAINLLQENLEVELPRRTRIAELSFTSTDAELSGQIANAYAAEFIQSNLQRKFDSSSYARTFVADQLEEARARLEASERELNAYARQAGLIRARDPSNPEANAAGSVTTSSLMQLNEAANAAEAERIAAEARWNAEQAQPLLSSQTVLASAAVQSLMTQRADLQSKLATARERYFDNHPETVALETELSAVERSLNQVATEVRNSVRAGYLAAAAAEERLRNQVNDLQSDTMAEQDRSVRYNTLAREADTNRSLYDGLLQRYRELNAAAGITASNVAIVDRAETPSQPSSPSLSRNLAIALLLGVALAAAIVFLRDQLDDRLRVPEEVEAKIGLPLLGVIPRSQDADPAPELDDPKSALTESYNALRTTLLYSSREGLPGILLVTSAQAAEGKTTTSYAIARGFARVGKKVLLVDGDLRRPSVHHATGLSNKAGLSSVLVGESTLQESVSTSAYENLHVLTSGPIPPSPAELLSSPRMAALLEEMDQAYDFVVIDSAPILGLADSTELAALADGVMIVIEADRGRGGQLKNALRRLRASKPVLLGVVLTKFDPTRAGNSYSYYGSDYYKYDSDKSVPA